MLRHVRIAFLALAALSSSANAQLESNFQNLLTGLTQGLEVTLLTPLSDGTVEVTNFFPPGRMTVASAAASIEQARATLASFGIEEPTGAQLAAALVGGTLYVPSGSTRLAGVLPPGQRPGSFTAQIVAAGALPQVAPPAGDAAIGGSAAAGASAPPSGMAIQLANQRLAELGITQPTPDQVRAMLEGGTVMTPSGQSLTLPGLLTRP
jgi:hypothetical protein